MVESQCRHSKDDQAIRARNATTAHGNSSRPKGASWRNCCTKGLQRKYHQFLVSAEASAVPAVASHIAKFEHCFLVTAFHQILAVVQDNEANRVYAVAAKAAEDKGGVLDVRCQTSLRAIKQNMYVYTAAE